MSWHRLHVLTQRPCALYIQSSSCTQHTLRLAMKIWCRFAGLWTSLFYLALLSEFRLVWIVLRKFVVCQFPSTQTGAACCRLLQARSQSQDRKQNSRSSFILGYPPDNSHLFSADIKIPHSSFDSSSDYKPDKRLVTKDQEEEPIAGDICLETFWESLE